MNNIYSVNNVKLTGEILSSPILSHELFGERFFEFNISIKRLSDAEDILPVTVSERLLYKCDINLGKRVTVIGQFRSYNKLIENKSKLILTVFLQDLTITPDEPYANLIELSGFICKAPIYRTTPFNREICDILVAVNRAYGKSDYIPAIAWGRNARFVKFLSVGEQIVINGRIQSRLYQKRINDIDMEQRTAYEVSIGKILIGESAAQFICESKLNVPDQSHHLLNDEVING
ncbi:MAG: single-stranded DNA-binding protein [Clostridia bacterium]